MKRSIKEPMQTHGLGRKIIQQIVTRHGGLLRTETGDDFYRVILALPSSAPEEIQQLLLDFCHTLAADGQGPTAPELQRSWEMPLT